MAYQIIWTSEADNDLYAIIDYLKLNWSDLSAEKFVNRIMKKIERIAEMPYVPRYTLQPNVQMIKLDRKNILFYKIENNQIVLLSIYPYKKDIKKSKYY